MAFRKNRSKAYAESYFEPENKMGQLISILSSSMRLSDIPKVTTDRSYCEALYKTYHLSE
jgi:hypothetical protein